MKPTALDIKKIQSFIIDNLVVIIFVSFTAAGFILSGGVSHIFFLNELVDRVFRNIFLVLSLIIPVIAGLGLNFGIVVGAMAGQFSLIFAVYHLVRSGLRQTDILEPGNSLKRLRYVSRHRSHPA